MLITSDILGVELLSRDGRHVIARLVKTVLPREIFHLDWAKDRVLLKGTEGIY